MRRQLVERRGWLSHREFLEDWALSKLSLGINQIALTGLIGARLGGAAGVAVSVVVLLVPSGVITAVVTAGYAYVRDDILVRSALSGAGPVIAGMTIAVAYTFAEQAVRRGRRAWIDWSYSAAVVAAGLALGLSPVVMIPIGIAVGLVFLRGETARASADPGT
jgi:chromate transporter